MIERAMANGDITVKVELHEPRCAECGDIITPGTLNAEGCTLEVEGWKCGVCVEAERPWPEL